jgi:hypothetical protein
VLFDMFLLCSTKMRKTDTPNPKGHNVAQKFIPASKFVV